MADYLSQFAKGDDYPVEKVSWADVQVFIEMLNRKTGQRYRLPTEAEWEFAARGGSAQVIPADLANGAWYRKNAGESTHPVGQKEPNGYGLHDMLGNVWEWCSDWDWGKEYPRDAQTNPQGALEGKNRVYRGGSWISLEDHVNAFVRNCFAPEERGGNLGFRLAMDRQPETEGEMSEGGE